MSQHSEMIQRFSAQLEKAERELGDALRLVADGIAPASEQIDRLGSSMSALRESYCDLKQLALGGAAESAEDERASRYIGIVEEREIQSLKNRFDDIVAVLERFESVRATAVQFDEAIAPFRDEARAVRDLLSSTEGFEVPEDIAVGVEDKRLFIDAVEMEDFDSAEGEELLDTLGEMYPFKVTQGLMLRKYYLSKEWGEQSDDGETPAASSSEQGESEEPADDTEGLEAASPADLQDEDEEDGNANEDELPGDGGEDVAGNGAEEDYLIAERFVKAPKNVSASSFKKDLLNRDFKSAFGSIRAVLPALISFGCLTERQVKIIADSISGGRFSSESTVSVIDYLVRKGLASSFQHESFGRVFCLTTYAASLLSKESIRTLRDGPKPYWVGSYEGVNGFDREIPKSVVERCVKTADCYIQYSRATEDADGVGKLGFSKVGTSLVDEAISVAFQWEGATYRCALIDDPCAIPADAENVVLIGGEEQAEVLSESIPGALFIVRDGTMTKWTSVPDDGGSSDAGTEIATGDSGALEGDGGELLASGSDDSSQPIGMTGGDPEEDSPEATGIHGAEKPLPDNFEPVLEANESESAASGEAETPKGMPEPEIAGGDGFPVEHEERDTAEELSSGTSEEACIIGGFDINSMIESADTPDDETLVAIAEALIEGIDLSNPAKADYSGLAQAISLLKASSQIKGHKLSRRLLVMLEMSTELNAVKVDRTGQGIAAAFSGFEEQYEPLMLSAYCLAMLSPQLQQDYSLRSLGKEYMKAYEETFPTFPEFKQLLNELSRAFDVFISRGPAEGFSGRIVRLLDDRKANQDLVQSLVREAAALVEQPTFKAHVNGAPELSRLCFGVNSDLQECMLIVSQDRREDEELVENTLSLYLDEGSAAISDEAIGNQIDKTWKAISEKDSSIKVKRIDFFIRNKTVDAFRNRLDVMSRWLDLGLPHADSSMIPSLLETRKNLLTIIDEIISFNSGSKHTGMSPVLFHSLMVIRGKLIGSYDPISLYADFLKSGIVSLDHSGMPSLDENLTRVRYYEPWRNVLRHLSSDRCDYLRAAELIFDSESTSFDNLGQLGHIGRVLGSEDPIFSISEDQVGSAKDSADGKAEEFQNFLEMAYLYNMVNEVQKESLSSAVRSFQDDFYARKDFGCWVQFIEALRRQVYDASREREEELSTRLLRCRETLRPKQTSSLLDEAEILLSKEKNYAVAEEYLNRFESGETEITEELSARKSGTDGFSEFISDEVFIPIFNHCMQSKGKPLGKFALQFIRDRYPADWTNRQKEDSEKLLRSWPSSQKDTKADDISSLLRSMGFESRGARQLLPGIKFIATIKPTKKDLADYPHPISAFGTKAIPELRVLVLYGNQTPEEIIAKVAQENVVGMSMVIVNHPISLSARRKVAELFHTQQSRLNPFILIDQVLAIYLALHSQAERLPLLLRCTLPFTYYQPFVRDGGPTADEMFCGRNRELRTIMDPNGASVVYGGRQLGKTALLERARSLSHHPDSKEYAVYVSILSCSCEEESAKAISEAISKSIPEICQCDSLKGLCDQIGRLIEDGKASKVLVLIDEADRFLASICELEYLPLQPLVDLKRATDNRFKFVLAGLHNVCRAKNATANNGIFGQLGEPLCVRPLQPSEALQLIKRPLTYLGFQIDRFPHLETILTNTNYYPGILQFFGYELIESMTRQYGDYYRAVDGNPPYDLRAEQLGAIMNSAQLNNSIKEKFRWSLELDPRYFMIARVVAMLYYEHEGEGDTLALQEGFGVDEIRENAESWQIRCLEDETASSYTALLDEMVDMGILSKPVPDRRCYRLRRYSFLNIIGPTEDSVFEDIVEHNEDGI